MVSGPEARYDVGPGSRKTNSTQELHAGRGVLLDPEDSAVLRGRRQAGPTVCTSRPRLPTGSSPAARPSAHRPSPSAPTAHGPGRCLAATTTCPWRSSAGFGASLI
jgi:hypothetical protein